MPIKLIVWKKNKIVKFREKNKLSNNIDRTCFLGFLALL